jgi:hypothetical protein
MSGVGMFTLSKSSYPGKSITVIFNGEDVSYKCSRALVPREQEIEADGWVEMRWDNGSPVERYNGRVMWSVSDAR